MLICICVPIKFNYILVNLLLIYLSLHLPINILYNFSFFNLNIVNTLWVGTLDMHPIILYIVIIFYIIRLLYKNCFKQSYIVFINNKDISILLLITLILGGL